MEAPRAPMTFEKFMWMFIGFWACVFVMAALFACGRACPKCDPVITIQPMPTPDECDQEKNPMYLPKAPDEYPIEN